MSSAVPPGASSPTDPRGTPVALHPDVGEMSVGELVGSVTRDLSTLMRQEIALARAEISQEATKAGKGAGMLAGAGLAGLLVLIFLSMALWAGLSELMDDGWAALIVALLWAVIAGALFAVGRSTLKSVNPKPERTVETLGHVPEALKPHPGGRS